MKPSHAKRAGTPYRTPRLKKYGELQRITKGPAKGGIAQDGGAGGPKSKLAGSIQ